jgi:thiamine-phosphate pyrophosphorylase
VTAPRTERGIQRRAWLAKARLLLVFTPEAAGENDPFTALERALDAVDVVQVRPKPLGESRARTAAREALDWTRRILELRRHRELLVIVNDRADVARALADAGCDGVHLGQEDMPAALARELLGPELLIGFSTHDAAQVALAQDEPVDYLGFGPVFPSRTKARGAGDARALGPERAWLAAESSTLPLFPIGGIDLTNADTLERIGRAAVSAGVLSAPDPLAAARYLREVVAAPDPGP